MRQLALLVITQTYCETSASCNSMAGALAHCSTVLVCQHILTFCPGSAHCLSRLCTHAAVSAHNYSPTGTKQHTDLASVMLTPANRSPSSPLKRPLSSNVSVGSFVAHTARTMTSASCWGVGAWSRTLRTCGQYKNPRRSPPCTCECENSLLRTLGSGGGGGWLRSLHVL